MQKIRIALLEYKKATLKKKDITPLIELVADNIFNEEINSLKEENILLNKS